MQTITLKNNESDRHFTVIRYPDGQNSVVLSLDTLDVKVPVTIKCRIICYAELEVLFSLVAALNKYDFHIKHIQFVYLFGQRSDRAFKSGEACYWRSVVAPLLNHLAEFADRITILTPHSRYGMSRLSTNIYETQVFNDVKVIENKIVIFGDKSAGYWDIYVNNRSDDPIYFDKIRKQDGGLIVTMHPLARDLLDGLVKENPDHPILLFDDMCDGGATFLKEGALLKEWYPSTKLELYVVHGLFTQGLMSLYEVFDKVHTTNSYFDWKSTERLNVIEVI